MCDVSIIMIWPWLSTPIIVESRIGSVLIWRVVWLFVVMNWWLISGGNFIFLLFGWPLNTLLILIYICTEYDVDVIFLLRFVNLDLLLCQCKEVWKSNRSAQ